MNAPPPGRRPRFPLGLAQMGQPAAPKPAADGTAAAAAAAGGAGCSPHEPAQPLAWAWTPTPCVRAWCSACGSTASATKPCSRPSARVLRHRFVDSALATQAYEDTSLPIGLEQTISKPSVVARMLALLGDTDAARARGSLGRVLEIGTGCGYQTALLAELARHVVSIERLKPLHDKARAHLDDGRGHHRIRLVWGDGRVGHGPQAPYDSIIAAAGGEDLPPAWLEQLADGGRLVAPMHEPGSRRQSLLVVDRQGDRYLRQRHETVLFVPLKSGVE